MLTMCKVDLDPPSPALQWKDTFAIICNCNKLQEHSVSEFILETFCREKSSFGNVSKFALVLELSFKFIARSAAEFASLL